MNPATSHLVSTELLLGALWKQKAFKGREEVEKGSHK